MEKTVGVLGGGQLGRMLVEAAHRLNIKVVLLDAANAPAKQIDSRHAHINGSFSDPEDVRRLARECDVITVEIEHVDTHVLEEIAETGVEIIESEQPRRRLLEVQPSWRTLRVIQDKYAQKQHLEPLSVRTAQSLPLAQNTSEELERVVRELGLPCMLKSRTQAYDGRGNYPIRTVADVSQALQALGKRPLYVERWANFKCELAVMVVKTSDVIAQNQSETWQQTTLAYPVVETVHEDSICKLVYAPARHCGQSLLQEAQALARRAVAGFWGKGIFGVELFLLEDDTLLVNEIAPRPHNSGHYTMETCPISQYDAHLRAILDLPFPSSDTDSSPRGKSSPSLSMNTPDTHAIMLNILGGSQAQSHLTIARLALTIPGAKVHLYGKGDARPGRKMGHVTVVAASMDEAMKRIAPLVEAVDEIRAQRTTASSAPPTQVAVPGAMGAADRRPSPEKAMVSVTMGSDSDLPVLKPGIALLAEFGIPFEVTITSAHRTPQRMIQFAQEAASRDVKVIIAAAGGAAHLPGMVAACTPLPVIGVPVKGSSLDGMDSLLSIVQMPRGVPVATVSINNSINAALLAARILGASDPLMRAKIEGYGERMQSGVLDNVSKLDAEGWQQYRQAG